MGIDAKCLVFLSQMCRTRPLKRCVTLGRQQLFIEPHLLAWASIVSKIPRHVLSRHNGAFAESLLIEYFGAVDAFSIGAFSEDHSSPYYVQSGRWHSWIIGWIGIRKYSGCVDLAQEAF